MIKHKYKFLVVSMLSAALLLVQPALAAPLVVNPDNTLGWLSGDTTLGGSVNFVADSSPSLGTGALELKTNSTTTAKAEYVNALVTPVSMYEISEIAYQTKQVSASFAGGSADFKLFIDLNGDNTVDTSLVFKPYLQNFGNPDSNPVFTTGWQTWDVAVGLFSSTEAVGGLANDGTLYRLYEVFTAPGNENARIMAVGVSVGPDSPNYNIHVDGVLMNDLFYDFEPGAIEVDPKPTLADQCKNGGWVNFDFKNQGQCVAYVQSNEHSKLHR